MEEHTPLPEGVEYVPGLDILEALPVKGELVSKSFGEMEIQIGYCNGHNSMLNALEYHKSSEVNVAATDAVLLLGSEQDMGSGFTQRLYQSGKINILYNLPISFKPCIFYTIYLHANLHAKVPCWDDMLHTALCIPLANA